MKKSSYNSKAGRGLDGSDSEGPGVPILRDETEQHFKTRLREVIGDKKLVWFAKECGFSDSLLGAYLRGEKLPGFENLVAIARVGSVSLDWLVTGHPPKTCSEAKFTSNQDHTLDQDIFKLAVEVVQEWQIAQGKFLQADKFVRAAELLTELSEGDSRQVRPLSAKVLRLAV